MTLEEKNTMDEKKIQMGFSIPDSTTEKEDNEKRISVMDEKTEEGPDEKPSQEDGGISE
jgi:hypothetical protein